VRRYILSDLTINLKLLRGSDLIYLKKKKIEKSRKKNKKIGEKWRSSEVNFYEKR